MHFYGLSDTHVFEMPIRRFWFLHKCIDRISAEKDTHALNVAISSQSGEGYSKLSERLQARVGKVVTVTEHVTEGEINRKALPNSWRDQAGFDALKGMGRTV